MAIEDDARISQEALDAYVGLPTWAQVMITLFVIIPLGAVAMIAAPFLFFWRKIRRWLGDPPNIHARGGG